jgi:hypothetical protein
MKIAAILDIQRLNRAADTKIIILNVLCNAEGLKELSESGLNGFGKKAYRHPLALLIAINFAKVMGKK